MSQPTQVIEPPTSSLCEWCDRPLIGFFRGHDGYCTSTCWSAANAVINGEDL